LIDTRSYVAKKVGYNNKISKVGSMSIYMLLVQREVLLLTSCFSENTKLVSGFFCNMEVTVTAWSLLHRNVSQGA